MKPDVVLSLPATSDGGAELVCSCSAMSLFDDCSFASLSTPGDEPLLSSTLITGAVEFATGDS